MAFDPGSITGNRILNFDQCYKCKLFAEKACTQIVHGFGNLHAEIIFIGEAPGYNEDKHSFPFIGKSGQLLRQLIRDIIGISDNDVFYTNIIRCHPENDRNPESAEIAACNEFLKNELYTIRPKIIVATGTFAARTIIGRKFQKITTDRRRVFQTDLCNCIVPIAHPASVRGSDAEIIQKKQQLNLDIYKIKELYEDVHKYKVDKSKTLSQPEITFGGFL